MEYKLEYFLFDEKKIFFLNKDVAIVGKLPSSDIELPDSTVSRQHCKLVRMEGQFKLIDLHSTNGSYVNGQKVEEKLLAVGDHITIGRTILKFLATDKAENYRDIGDQRISMMVPLADLDKAEKKHRIGTEASNLFARLTLLSKELIASPSLDDSFQKVGQLIFDFIKPEKVFIFSFDEKQNDLILKCSFSKKRKKDDTAHISKTIALKAIHEKVAILSSNTRGDSRFDSSKSILMYGITSAISVPIWTKDSIYGLIYVDTTSFEKLFGEMDLEVLSMIANFSGLTIESFNSLEKLNRERKLRARLERYHSPAVVSRLLEMQDTPPEELMTYREAEASVLFMDIVDFTTLAERKTPVEVGVFLNNFFTEMTEIIFKFNGTLDKYIGDAIMAVFGVPIEFRHHAERAIYSALEMLDKLKDMNRHIPAEDRFRIRVGIHSGKLISGDFGSPKRLDYTVLGNTVNIASRLESSIASADEIVVSDSVYQATRDKFDFDVLGEKKLQGISKSVKVYRVLRKKEGK